MILRIFPTLEGSLKKKDGFLGAHVPKDMSQPKREPTLWPSSGMLNNYHMSYSLNSSKEVIYGIL